MIRADKVDRALESLHRALTIARGEAALAGQENLSRILDHLEQLPCYIADPRADLTDRFRAVLTSLEMLLPDHAALTYIFDDDEKRTHRWY